MRSMREGNLDKEYMTGRRDQFDLDLTTFWESVKETKSREELIKTFRDKMSMIISRLAFERAKNLQMEIELIEQYYHSD
ncbi:MAG: hypothetical protein M1290_04160 [Candidatus Thermoplasmatota archaeon]|jgi:hypothetical protein|nr:hypothetical protein [Candidatus Thermoplasmatota archaeon]MCL5789644.1 hypothetical protein [Candidatus Thermoplasmatota archaeon]